MKKIILTLSVLYFSMSISAQNTFPSNGNVGIGTSSPGATLQIVRGGTNSGADYASVNVATASSGNVFGPILYLNGTSGTGGRNWGVVSSGALDAQATGVAGNFAIYDESAGKSRLVISSSGNVGIGTLNPTTGLLVAQGLITSQTAATLTAGNNDSFNLFAGGGGYVNGARQNILWSQAGLTIGRFGTEYSASRNQVDFIWRDLYNQGASSTESMRLTAGGNLGIGTSNPDAKLAVNGTVHSKEVKVDLTGWPDYVFHKDYKLPALEDVKTYIDQNHHLPEVPSEQDVVEKGLNLGEMNKLLMKKVEELTLYLIENHKIQKKQQREINHLKKLSFGQIKKSDRKHH